MKPVDYLFPEAKKKRDAQICPTCNQPLGEFRDILSEQESKISGLCQECQDAIFGGDDDE